MSNSKIWECPKCKRVFAKAQPLGTHLAWCGKGRSGHSLSAESRQKLSEAKRNPSAKTRQRLSDAHKGAKNPLYGKRHSAETKRKMSEAQCEIYRNTDRRQKASEAARRMQCGADNHNYGKPRSAEHRQKISEALRGKYCGAENSRWKGGPFPYGPDWLIQRRRARIRDNFTCQQCGVTEAELGHRLSVHHIRPFRESKDNSLENLISLCHTRDNGCHLHCEYHPEDCPVPRKHWLLTQGDLQVEEWTE